MMDILDKISVYGYWTGLVIGVVIFIAIIFAAIKDLIAEVQKYKLLQKSTKKRRRKHTIKLHTDKHL